MKNKKSKKAAADKKADKLARKKKHTGQCRKCQCSHGEKAGLRQGEGVACALPLHLLQEALPALQTEVRQGPPPRRRPQTAGEEGLVVDDLGVGHLRRPAICPSTFLGGPGLVQQGLHGGILPRQALHG